LYGKVEKVMWSYSQFLTWSIVSPNSTTWPQVGFFFFFKIAERL
jgi:hypothetical protein